MIKLTVSFPLIGRHKRNLKNTPKDFFYGTNNLTKRFKVDYVDSRNEPKNLSLKILKLTEFFLVRLRLSVFNRLRVFVNSENYTDSDIIISFTDHYSLNLGLFFKKKKSQLLIGVFHGFSDILDRQPFFLKWYAKQKTTKAIKKLDRLVFLGKPDMIEAKRKFTFISKKSSMLTFGVDHFFWISDENREQDIDVLCVGSDRNRDYEILKEVSTSIKFTLITTKKINCSSYKNITHINSNLYNSVLTDQELKKYYQRSKIILIPLKDVFQPSGQSVLLQAMSCSKSVIMTKTKGLFEKKLLKDDHNIKFVPPNSSRNIEKRILELIDDDKKRMLIGKLARETIVNNFTLKHMSRSLENILNKTLKDNT